MEGMMQATEPWDPLGDYFARDIVDDLFDEGPGFMEGMMAERTYGELAEALRKYTRHLKARGLNTALMDEIEARLRSMPEGERVEGWARDRGFPHDKRTVWSFSKDKHGTTDEMPATIIIEHGEDKSE